MGLSAGDVEVVQEHNAKEEAEQPAVKKTQRASFRDSNTSSRFGSVRSEDGDARRSRLTNSLDDGRSTRSTQSSMSTAGRYSSDSDDGTWVRSSAAKGDVNSHEDDERKT
jgi:hypothetical protein